LERFTESLFYGGDLTTGPPADLSTTTLLKRGQLEADGLRNDPPIQAEMFATLGRAFEHLGDLDRADTLLQHSLEKKKELFGAASAEYARAMLMMGELRKDQGRIQESIGTLRQALNLARHAYSLKDSDLAQYLSALGSALTQHGDYPESKALLSEAVQDASRDGNPSLELAESFEGLGEVEFYLAHYAQSASFTQDALQQYRALYGPSHPLVAHVLDTLGNISQNEGHIAEAEQYFRQALAIDSAWYGPNHPAVAAELTSLAKFMAARKLYSDAQDMLERALAIQHGSYGETHSQVALALNELGVLASTTGREKDAERDFRGALSIWRAVYGDRHQFVGLAYANLASVYMARKQYQAAEEACRNALRVYSVSLPPNHPNLAVLHVKLGRILLRQSRFAEAEPETLLGYKFFTSHESGLTSYAEASRKDLAEIEHHLKPRYSPSTREANANR
jgi:serine/threonine-protein kinase